MNTYVIDVQINMLFSYDSVFFKHINYNITRYDIYVSILGIFWAQHTQTKSSLSKQSMMKDFTKRILFPQPSE